MDGVKVFAVMAFASRYLKFAPSGSMVLRGIGIKEMDGKYVLGVLAGLRWIPLSGRVMHQLAPTCWVPFPWCRVPQFPSYAWAR